MSMTVCIPACNGAPYIEATLRSILAQTRQDFECIVVDDVSEDGTLEVVRSLDDPRIQVYRNDTRLGTAANRNRCLELTRTDLVCLIDQDDLMLPDNLARKTEILAADPSVSFVHSAAEVLTEAGTPPPAAWRPAPDDNVDGTAYFRKLLFQGNEVCACSVVTRSALLRERGGFDVDVNYTCDYEMWMKLAINYRVAFVGTPLVCYRWHDRNQSHRFSLLSRIEEIALAGRRAVHFFSAATGRQDEARLLEEAFAAVVRGQRIAAEIDAARAWLEADRDRWQRAAAECGVAPQGELLGREGKISQLQSELEACRAALAAYEASRWFRLGVLCKRLLGPRASTGGTGTRLRPCGPVQERRSDNHPALPRRSGHRCGDQALAQVSRQPWLAVRVVPRRRTAPLVPPRHGLRLGVRCRGDPGPA
jgi:GT2 family glycosyltransferase